MVVAMHSKLIFIAVALALFNTSELAMIAIALDEEEEQQHEQKKRKLWVHDAWKSRETEGEFHTLYKELVKDEKKYFEYFKMSEACFNSLLQKLGTKLLKKDTRWRKSISPRERLAICLRYLTTGDSLKTISFSYRVGHSTAYTIVMETCKIIKETLMAEMLPLPTEDKWKSIANDYQSLWNFPNCIGALDGKHITIQAPKNSGSLYFNYKKTFSIVLMALVDANYNFIAVDVGAYGKNSDGGIFANSNLGKRLQQGSLGVPGNSPLPGTSIEMPHVIVGDEAFPLKTYLMRPYPGHNLSDDKRIFNYRLSRARRVVENTFGILTQKFRIYHRRIQASPQNVDNIVLATCILHNYIKKFNSAHPNAMHDSDNLEDNTQPSTSILLENLQPQGGNSVREAFHVRESFKNYFNSDAGSVPWQDDKI